MARGRELFVRVARVGNTSREDRRASVRSDEQSRIGNKLVYCPVLPDYKEIIIASIIYLCALLLLTLHTTTLNQHETIFN